MGQRLVTNIKRNHKIILSAYFHWTGYSSSSFEMTSIMIDNIRNMPDAKTANSLKLAATIFEGTDHNPTLEMDERQRLEKTMNLEGYESLLSTSDRNEGLIAITPKGIEELSGAGEVTVEIDITNETVINDLLYVNEYTDEEPDVAEVTMLPYNPEEELSFDNYQELAAFYLDNKDSYRFMYQGQEYAGIE